MVARFRVPSRIASLLLVASLLIAAAPPQPFAIVASVKGRVDVTAAKGGATTVVGFGDALERGDRLAVATGGTVTVLFNDGNVVELGERSAMTIGGRADSKPRADAAPAVSGEVYAGVSQFVTGGSRETGLVALSTLRSGPDSSPLLLTPRKTELLDGRPSFHWRAVEGATRYRVSVSGDDGELWDREVAATMLEYPSDVAALTPGGDFLWEVRALSDHGELRREETSVRVLAAADADSVRASLARIGKSTGGPETEAARFLAGSYLFSRGLMGDAGQQLEALIALAPDSATPHESLGNVYRAVGLMDLAATEYQRALTLRRGR